MLAEFYRAAATQESIWQHILRGGPVMWPILALAAAALLVGLVKWVSLLFVRKPAEKKVADKAAAADAKKAVLEEKEIKRAFAKEDGAAAREKEQAENNRVRAFREQQRAQTKASAEEKIGFLGGMSGLNAAQAVTGLVAGIVKQFADFKTESAIRSAAIASGGIVAANTTDQIGRIHGPRGEDMASSDFQKKRSELEKLKAQRESISDAPEDWLSQIKSGTKEVYGIDLGETSSDREKRELEEKIVKATAAETNARKQAEHKFRDGVGGEELKALHDRAEGRYAEAKLAEWHIAGQKKYQELINRGATQEQALQGQHDTIQLQEREWQQKIGRTLTGRSGQAAISRAAGIAREGFGGGAVAAEFKSLREQIASQHVDILNARPMANFGPRLPR